jgi:hypothetical protein
VLGALDADGFAVTAVPVLPAEVCADLANGFDDLDRYRSTVDMAAHRFGEGTYRYFRYPLPPAVASLREAAYPPLAKLADQWATRLGREGHPSQLADLLDRCHARGQTRPTPLVLRYGPGGWNALHQDLYGEVWFPFQLTVALTRPNVDFTGGENVFVEQRPRAQSRAGVVTVPLGHAVVFATNHRPVAGGRGVYRATMRHGVSTVTSGTRSTLGVIFHDAT